MRCVRSVNSTASPTVITRLAAVPRIAARLLGPVPCASVIVASITASAPTTATASGLLPSRIAGHHEQQHHREAQGQPDQRQGPACAAEQHHEPGEQQRQQQHRPPPLEVGERELLSRDRLGPGRHHVLDHPHAVARVDVGIEPAGAQLDLGLVALPLAGLDGHGDPPADVGLEARAAELLDAFHAWRARTSGRSPRRDRPSHRPATGWPFRRRWPRRWRPRRRRMLGSGRIAPAGYDAPQMCVNCALQSFEAGASVGRRLRGPGARRRRLRHRRDEVDLGLAGGARVHVGHPAAGHRRHRCWSWRSPYGRRPDVAVGPAALAGPTQTRIILSKVYGREARGRIDRRSLPRRGRLRRGRCRTGGGAISVVATTTQLGDFARAGRRRRAPTSTRSSRPTPTRTTTSRGPATPATLEGADVVLRSGGDLDEWLSELIDSSGTDAEGSTSRASVRAAAGRSALVAGPAQRRARRSRRSGDALVEADPDGRGDLRAQRRGLPRAAPRLDARVARCIDKLPRDARKLVTTHDALGYYADRYGLEVIGAVIPSLSQPGTAVVEGHRRAGRPDPGGEGEGDLPRVAR